MFCCGRSGQKRLQCSSEFFLVACFTLPNDQNSPAILHECIHIRGITLLISMKFWKPIFCSRFWQGRIFASRVRMLMPKTAMYEDYCTPPQEYEIRLPRKVFSVQPVSVPKMVSEPPHKHLGFCIAASNARHVGATAFRGQFVHLIYVVRFPQKVNLIQG